jgi:hypothetical protein
MLLFHMTSPGEEKAWDILKEISPPDICRNAAASYNEDTRAYTLRSFCIDFRINPEKRTIESCDPSGENIIRRFAYFFNHAVLWYLIYAKDIPLTGRLVRPSDVKGGQMFFRGSHAVPLDTLANKYGSDKEAFMKRGRELCAGSLDFGDASLRLLPAPGMPVTLVLWLGDEEFPARADLLLDSSCELQFPIDIIWSMAMLSVLAMI